MRVSFSFLIVYAYVRAIGWYVRAEITNFRDFHRRTRP